MWYKGTLRATYRVAKKEQKGGTKEAKGKNKGGKKEKKGGIREEKRRIEFTPCFFLTI